MDPVSVLIEAAFAGRKLTAAEVQVIAEHVAAAGFDPGYLVPAGYELAGMPWRGRTLDAITPLTRAEVHYLKHVRLQREWPIQTTLEGYQQGAAAVARSPESGILVSRYQGKETIGVIGPTPEEMRGPGGFPLTLIEYRVRTQYWSTAFQVAKGLDYLENDAGREIIQWLRRLS